MSFLDDEKHELLNDEQHESLLKKTERSILLEYNFWQSQHFGYLLMIISAISFGARFLTSFQ